MIAELFRTIRQGILGQLWSMEYIWITSRVGQREGTPAHRDPRSYLFRQEVSRGGILHWLGCHFLDLALHLSGEPATSVMAMTSQQTTDEIEVEDTAGCLIRFDSGMLASLHVGYLLPEGGQVSIRLQGSKGWAYWDSREGRTLRIHSEDPRWKAAPTRSYDYPIPVDATYGDGAGELLLTDFARCIRDQGSEPAYTREEAIAVLRVLDAAYRSAETGAVSMI